MEKTPRDKSSGVWGFILLLQQADSSSEISLYVMQFDLPKQSTWVVL